MFKKFFTKALLYNVLIAVAMVVILLLSVQYGLKNYTRHGESIEVPDLHGKNLEALDETLSDLDLDWVIIDSVFNLEQPPLTVVEQNPKPKSKVKEGRTIYITVNASRPPLSEMPDLVGRSSYKYAKMQLESYGFKVGEPIYRPDPHLNAVIGVTIDGKSVAPKTKIPKGSEVILILGDGLGGARIPVPYLIGLRFDEAMFKLKGYSLNVGAYPVDEGVTDTTGAVVYRQVPAFGQGSYIHLGESVDLFLAKQLPDNIEVHPEYYDMVDSAETEP